MTLMVLGGLSAEEAVAWLAAIAAAASLTKQALDAVRKRRKEHDELEEALDHAPQVREQLELGNVGAAVGHLNVIMQSQAVYIKDQDFRLGKCNEEIQHLKELLQAAEAEAQGWETKYLEEARLRRLDVAEARRRYNQIEQELEETKRVFARRMAALMEQIDSKQGEQGEVNDY